MRLKFVHAYHEKAFIVNPSIHIEWWDDLEFCLTWTVFTIGVAFRRKN